MKLTKYIIQYQLQPYLCHSSLTSQKIQNFPCLFIRNIKRCLMHSKKFVIYDDFFCCYSTTVLPTLLFPPSVKLKYCHFMHFMRTARTRILHIICIITIVVLSLYCNKLLSDSLADNHFIQIAMLSKISIHRLFGVSNKKDSVKHKLS